ncbi:MAG TPA: methyltransferase [Afifellaceae bacterium]|nr:methyltransferase [Afifellaceae bacterium]
MTGNPAQTHDLFLGGRVSLIQGRSGHRAGLDAALLQAAVPSDAAGNVADLGTGNGVVALSVAARAPAVRVTGTDRDGEALECAAAALALPENAGFAGRVRWVEADVTAARAAREAAGLPDGRFDWVLMNPPFAEAGRVRASLDPGRSAAHVAGPEALAGWIAAAAGLMRPRGRLAIVHRPDALPAILQALAGRFGGARLMPFFPHEGEPATRIVVGAIRASRAPLALLPGLVLHDADGSWTEEARAILDGSRALPLW